ncbi:MarR family winged helix-turn-helix transcriptional regulator [Plantactinospora endophytica]|uniref:HTH marR-type domain-containing protein n=1 Tax=Plantactinospora endophytica TaxID=673535 RepID=A0ABQ4ED51_9ACTN|nr:MarR family winged helix-turn-helix transcriptional regulator [Plantactinospora endophytica]GIG92206.1 hypothetical protein Pen02_71420 [Plantactinospora endophytica]
MQAAVLAVPPVLVLLVLFGDGPPVEAEVARLDLTKAEYDILAVLRSPGKRYRLRPSVLTQRLVLTCGGTSNVLRRLAVADLIERDPDPSDARSSWVRLAASGVSLAEEAVRAASAARAAALRGVAPAHHPCCQRSPSGRAGRARRYGDVGRATS